MTTTTLPHRFLWLAGTWLLALAPLPSLAGDPVENHLLVIANDETVGKLDSRQDGGHVDISYAVDNNGRGPKTKEALELDARGYPLSWKITGSSLFGAPVDEGYEWQDGTSTWHSQADQGAVAASEPAMYIGGDASPWALGMYARALLNAPDQTLAVLPSGRMHLEKLDTPEAGTSALPITIYQLSGIGLEPALIALDGRNRLFARFGGRGGLIRAGFEDALPGLNDWARDYELRRLQGIQERLAHSYQAPIRYRNVRVFDTFSRTLGDLVSVLVKDGRIAAVEPPGAAGDPATEVTVDGQGGTLVPGLIDMHSHSTMESGLYYLAVGVTSTRDMGNDNELLPRIRKAIADGELAGPRITPNGLIEARSPFSVRIGIVVDSLDEALDAVRWYAARGYFEIKTYNSFKKEWVLPVVAEAHRLGMGVTGHVPAFMSPDAVIEAGYSAIAHINQLMLGWLLAPDEDTRTPLRLTGMKRAAHLDLASPRVRHTIELIQEHSTALDTTAVILERLMLSRAGETPPGDEAYLSHMPIGYQRYRKRTFVPLNLPTDDADYQAAFDTLLKTIKLLYDNHIQLLPGTDDTTGFTLQRELELYVKAGLPPADVLTMATLGSATYLKTQDEIGSITPGKFADFLLVAGNPVADISAIRPVRLVSRGGVIYFPAEIYQALNIEPFGAPVDVQAPGSAK